LVDDRLAAEMAHWLEEARSGSPFATWRERYVDAVGALQTRGDTVASVLAGQTASEVLLDGMLSLLMWEEGVEPEVAAQAFEEGQAVTRMSREMPARLKGVWTTTGSGSVAQWFEDSYKLRHRVVHGGYTPSRIEAEAALGACSRLRTHLLDRLSARRNAYMRATLMTVGEPGLLRRGLWAGKIREFAEGPAQSEPNWRESFHGWHIKFVEARLAAL
jgi:hypothetical protein